MKKLFTVFIFLYNFSFAQSPAASVNLNFEPSFVTGDILGNIYIIHGSELLKYNDKVELCCTFSDKTYGEISSVDTRDPLRILLFYKPFGVIRLLDNKLAEQSVIELRKLEITDPSLVCTSETQGIWVYDNATSRLYKFDASLQPVGLTNDLRQDINRTITPSFMAESDYWLVMLDKNSLLIFDKMGSYFKPLPLPETLTGQLLHDEWLCIADGKLLRFNIRTGNSSEAVLPFKKSEGTLYVLPGKIVRVFDKKMEIYTN
jgi:hypothetical protein